MDLNFQQITSINETLMALKDKPLPFKLSLIIAKNCALLANETQFFIERERDFAHKYLKKNDDGTFMEESPGVYRIIEGMEQECNEARKELDGFTVDVELRKIPMNLLESLELTPAQVAGLDLIIEEE